VEYDVEVRRPNRAPEPVTLIGKARAGRFGKADYALLDAFWHAGFQSDSPDGISVAEPIAIVADFRMWLQRKVPGRVSTDLLAGEDGVMLTRRIAEAAHKIHRASAPTDRRHSMADELRILHQCLATVAQAEPAWGRRIERVLDACDRLGAATPELPLRGIHRDFYADQVIIDGGRLYLLDFDLYCLGSPALDIGNFLGHITEQSLRTLGLPDALANVERALEERFLELSGAAMRQPVRSYRILTLARHIYLSTRFSERRAYTEPLLDLVEERLGAPARAGA
jgi:Ser/Thr protein kinase RdoA (MazF antagonist)